MNRFDIRKWLGVALFAASCIVLTGCPTEPKSEVGRQDLTDEATATINKFERTDPGMTDLLNRADGYAVFPSIGAGGFIAGAAYGKGTVYEHGQKIGYCDMTQGSIGFQIIGKEYAELIVFETPDALTRFKTGDFTFSADATAVALTVGAAAQAKFKDGAVVFTQSLKGLGYQAVLAGQKFRFATAPIQQ